MSMLAYTNCLRTGEMPDEEIVVLAQANDQPATEYLVDKYKNFVGELKPDHTF